MKQPTSYSLLQIALHWTIAVLVILQFVINADMRQAFQTLVLGAGPALAEQKDGVLFHIIAGTAILLLTVLRLGVRFWRGAPAPEAGIPPFIAHIATLTHVLFYALLIAMPVTGLFAWGFASETFGMLHETGRLLLLPAVLAHALGALVEHFVLRNDTLRRMLAMTDR